MQGMSNDESWVGACRSNHGEENSSESVWLARLAGTDPACSDGDPWPPRDSVPLISGKEEREAIHVIGCIRPVKGSKF